MPEFWKTLFFVSAFTLILFIICASISRVIYRTRRECLPEACCTALPDWFKFVLLIFVLFTPFLMFFWITAYKIDVYSPFAFILLLIWGLFLLTFFLYAKSNRKS